jgi:hypothetical protein
MSPVRQRPERSPRAILIGVIGLVVGIGAVLALFVVAIPTLTENQQVEVRLGDDRFDAGPAEQRAAAVADGGPLLFPDVASGQRDIYLQHVGDDATTGWVAFAARTADAGVECTVAWQSERRVFVDPCTGSVFPADGTGLAHYEVVVDDDGHVIVDLRPDDGT